MRRIEDIIETLQENHPKADIDLVRRGYVFSAQAHKGQLRADRQPYLSHPLEVGGILADLRMDEVVITAGLLHDTLEDTNSAPEEIKERFGEEVFSLVDGVSKIGGISFPSKEAHQVENYRKFILAMSKDIRVIIIKLADRLHNMRTLESLPERKQKTIARETMDIYAPLAHRLGIATLRWELEDYAFRYLQPDEYQEISRQIVKHRKEREAYIQQMADEVKKMLETHGIEAEVVGRPKHFYSIFDKMQRRGIPFQEVYDLIALRIITNSIQDCYAVLGTIHTLWKPIPRRFKDYIALPKPNLYQSLHTTVSGPGGEMVEFQIRTKEMHRVAEMGIAAHWAYKQGEDAKAESLEQFAWLRAMLEWQEEISDPREYLSSLKIDLFPNEIYVFTPKGDVVTLPKEATVIDFAYSIHTEVGHHCQQGRVNGRLVPLKTVLNSGDKVEIITSPTREPSRDWLGLAKSTKAKAKVRQFLKTQERERSLALGREILERHLRKHHLTLKKVEKDGRIENAAREFGFLSSEALCVAVGYGKVTGRQVIGKIATRLQEPQQIPAGPKKPSRTEKEGISIKGLEGMMIRFAKCCNPLPGDQIVGFITRGRGVTVHSRDCPNIEHLLVDPDRALSVEWADKGGVLRTAYLMVECLDRPGILASLSSAIAEQGGNISKASAEVKGEIGINRFAILVKDLHQLDRIVQALRKLKGVTRVARLRVYRRRS